MRTVLCTMAVLLCLWAPSAAQEPLTLEQAIKIGLDFHPAVAQGEARVAANRLYAEHIGAQPNPVLTVSATAGTAGEDSNALQQTFEISGQPRLRAAVARAQTETEQERLAARRRALALETARAYYQLWRNRELRRLGEAQLQLADSLETTSRRRLEEGAISRNQHLRAGLSTAAARSSLAALVAAERGSEADLNLLLGRPAATAVELETVEPLPFSSQLEEVLERVGNRPELASARHLVSARELQTELAGKGNAPRLQVSAYQARLGSAREQGLQLSLVLPLWDWGQQKAAQERAAQLEEAQRQEVRRLQLDLSRELVGALTRYQGAHDRRRLLEQQADDYVHLTNMARRGYEAGLLTLIEVLETERAYRSNSTSYIEARYNELVARYELAYAALEPLLPEEK